MSDQERDPRTNESSAQELVHESPALDALVGEARTHMDAPDLDWSRIEARLMESIEESEKSEKDESRIAEVVPLKPRVRPEVAEPAQVPSHMKAGDASRTEASDRRARLLRVGAMVLAAAAAVTLVMRSGNNPTGTTSHAPTQERGAVASSLTATEGKGEVRIGGVVAGPGHVLRGGDTIDAKDARAVFDSPGKVAWLVEHDVPASTAHAKVKLVGARPSTWGEGDIAEPLVLGIEDRGWRDRSAGDTSPRRRSVRCRHRDGPLARARRRPRHASPCRSKWNEGHRRSHGRRDLDRYAAAYGLDVRHARDGARARRVRCDRSHGDASHRSHAVGHSSGDRARNEDREHRSQRPGAGRAEAGDGAVHSSESGSNRRPNASSARSAEQPSGESTEAAASA
jgi:hypothetical protein